jgi:hypothetical protein
MPENELTISIHQAFVTRQEMLAGVAVHARSIALCLDQHLTTDLSNLNLKWLFEEVKRMEELIIQANNATMAEIQLKNANEFANEAKISCELTVTKPDGSVE